MQRIKAIVSCQRVLASRILSFGLDASIRWRDKLFIVFSLSVFLLSPTSFADQIRPLSGLNMLDFEQSKDSELQWNNNPFIKQVDQTNVYDLVPSAIISSDKNSSVLINGNIYQEGDKIGTSEIVSIEPQHVVLRNSNGVFQVAIGSKKK